MSTIALRTYVGTVQPTSNCPVGTIWIDTSSTPAVKICTVADTTFVDVAPYIGVGSPSGEVLTLPQINDTSSDHQYVFAVSELAADRTVTLPLLLGNDVFVFADFIQTLTNKTLTSPVLTTPQINDTSSDHQYILGVSELAADRTVTLPLLAGNDVFVFADFIQTLTNKTLTAPAISDPTITGAITRASQSFSLNAAIGYAADAAGWAAPTTVAEACVRLPASKTALKWIVPITGIHVGDIITGYKVNGQAESAGNAYTLDCDIYESTMAAGDITEASKSAAITQVTGSADAIIAATKASLSITVATDKPLYFLLTGTTAASTDLAVASIEVTVTQK